MASSKADIEPDISGVIDRQESVTLMEPLLIAEGSRHRGELTDRATDPTIWLINQLTNTFNLSLI